MSTGCVRQRTIWTHTRLWQWLQQQQQLVSRQGSETPAELNEDVFRVVHDAQEAAFDAVAPGMPAQEIDRAARRVISDAGYGERFFHRTGHGIGLELHEPPYLVEGNEEPLETGSTFSIEPGIYLEGRFGVRIEDIVVVTDGGAERYNRSSRDLRVVE